MEPDLIRHLTSPYHNNTLIHIIGYFEASDYMSACLVSREWRDVFTAQKQAMEAALAAASNAWWNFQYRVEKQIVVIADKIKTSEGRIIAICPKFMYGAQDEIYYMEFEKYVNRRRNRGNAQWGPPRGASSHRLRANRLRANRLRDDTVYEITAIPPDGVPNPPNCHNVGHFLWDKSGGRFRTIFNKDDRPMRYCWKIISDHDAASDKSRSAEWYTQRALFPYVHPHALHGPLVSYVMYVTPELCKKIRASQTKTGRREYDTHSRITWHGRKITLMYWGQYIDILAQNGESFYMLYNFWMDP